MRRKSRRRIKPVSKGHERWLITYADLITLLMIFFVIMFSVSQIDADKYDSLSQDLRTTFRHADGVLEDGKGVMEGQNASVLPHLPVNPTATNPTQQPMTERELQFRQQEQELQQFKSVIETYVQDHQLSSEVSITDTEKGISIHLSDQFLFDLGKAELKEKSQPMLNKLGSLFSQLDTTISIEGHTDDLVIQPGGTYKDNWELSAARALSVLRYFIDQAHLEANKFQIAGYGDTHPVAPNDSALNRQKNRRVEMIVLRKLQQ
jgi:chemotaxis protein MotB